MLMRNRHHQCWEEDAMPHVASRAAFNHKGQQVVFGKDSATNTDPTAQYAHAPNNRFEPERRRTKVTASRKKTVLKTFWTNSRCCATASGKINSTVPRTRCNHKHALLCAEKHDSIVQSNEMERVIVPITNLTVINVDLCSGLHVVLKRTIP